MRNDGWADTQDEGNSHFFAVFANALKNYQVLILSKFIIQVFSFAYFSEFKTPVNEEKVSATEFVNFLRWFRLIQINCNIVVQTRNKKNPL